MKKLLTEKFWGVSQSAQFGDLGDFLCSLYTTNDYRKKTPKNSKVYM